MKRLILCLTAILLCVSLFAGGEGAAAGEEALKTETYQHINAAGEKQRALATKQYAGTLGQILAARVADVNEVTVEIAAAKAKAVELMTLTGDPNDIKAAIQRLICEKTKQADQEQKKRNGDFLGEVEQQLAEQVPDPNDLDEAARVEDLRRAVLDVVDKMGGI